MFKSLINRSSKSKNRLSKSRLAAILTLSFSAAFMVFLFTPLDLYLHNPTDFLLSWTYLLPALFLIAVSVSIVFVSVFIAMCSKTAEPCVYLLIFIGISLTFMWFVLHLLSILYYYMMAGIVLTIIVWILLKKRLKENAVDVMMLVLWGAVVAAYVQILFLNKGMVLLTGDRMTYSIPRIAFNLLIWVVITLLPLCIWIFFRRKEKAFKLDKPIIFTMLIISGMQIAGLVSAAVTSELPAGFEADLQYFSYEYTLDFNADENILVFILDRLDVDYMTETLEKYPELSQKLDGFTFYRNNVSEYEKTFPSVTTMLTQHDYREGLTFGEYWKEAWAKHSAVDTLRENGFNTYLFIDKLSTYGNFDEIQDKTDNLISGDPQLNIREMITINGRLSLGRLMPYCLKGFFLNEIDSSFGNDLFTIIAVDPFAVQQPSVGNRSDLGFYRYFSQNDLSANNENKVFRFIHLNCAHADWDIDVTTGGYHYDDSTKTIVFGGNYIDSTHACFEILDAYFKKMKEIGVYDNTTIIMLGDHGATFDKKITATLLIKPKGARGELVVNNDKEMSNRYLGASILEAAGIPHEDLGVSYFDIIRGTPPPARFYYNYKNWWGSRVIVGEEGKIALKDVYKITGDANDPKNWKLVG